MARQNEAGESELLDLQEIEIAERTLRGETVREIGGAIGLHPTQVNRIQHRPNVAAYIASTCADAADAVRRRIVNAAPRAVKVLVSIAEDEEAPANARVAAAGKLVDVTVPRQVRHAGHDGGAIRVESPERALTTLTDEELDRMANLLSARLGDGG